MGELKKEITNGHMLKNTGSWLYCDECNKTVGYLCYSTYQKINFEFRCKCGNAGSFSLEYHSIEPVEKLDTLLKVIKNRLCCPNDNAPFFSFVKKHLNNCKYSVTCNKCNTNYNGGIKW